MLCGSSKNGVCEVKDNRIIYTAGEKLDEVFFSLEITFPEWEEDCYVMMPACVYNGNRFKKVIRKYPPMYLPEEAGVDCEPLITDVPALNPDGSGMIQVTAGDMAVPCVGIFNRVKKQGFFIFTGQEIKGRNIGFTLERGRLNISYPANRTDLYRFCRPHDKTGDKGITVEKGEEIASEFRINTFQCGGIEEFYKKYFELRKSQMCSPRASFLYTKELWDIMEKHFNDDNFSGEYYGEISKVWQCGWVGGGMSNYPLLKYGNELSRERAVKTIDFLTKYQAASGFYHGIVRDGVVYDDSFSTSGMEHLHMTRKSADVLYFLFKNLSLIEAKPSYTESARRCADAFVELFRRYGTFGQFVDVETGEMKVGCSTSAAIASAALVKAWEFFGDKKYIETARRALKKYMEIFLKTGVTNGGPGEILSAPDSESAFGLLESCVVLYEADRNPDWLKYSETVAQYCSSWVVTYQYKFPEGCEFDRLKINTVGSVFANVQNKHSAPGLCTLSGDSLLKLYRYTGNREYLELIKDIAYFIPQCVSTKERPIMTWDNPPKALSPGYINERVNMSDWETEKCVGGVFYGSCWSETSLLLSFAELMTEDEMLPQELLCAKKD